MLSMRFLGFILFVKEFENGVCQGVFVISFLLSESDSVKFKEVYYGLFSARTKILFTILLFRKRNKCSVVVRIMNIRKW